MTKSQYNTVTDVKAYSQDLGRKAKAAAAKLSSVSIEQKDRALKTMARLIRERTQILKNENARDIANARQADLSAAMIDRLELTDKRIEAMAVSLEQVAAQTDPVGRIIEGYRRPNGLEIQKVRVPIGVVAIIYESRPNVTADAAGLCLRASNACILRGGKEAIHSNLAIAQCLREALKASELPVDSVQVVQTTDRALVNELLKLNEYIDLVIPRGGESLIRTVVELSTIPVIKHYAGNCHIYVDRSCALDLADLVIVNAKCQRPAVCNAVETVLFHEAIADEFIPPIGEHLIRLGVEIRGCPRTCSLLTKATAATEQDWRTEYLDLVLAVRVVSGLDEAITHINTYGSHHTDAILSSDLPAVDRFVNNVDSASVMVNTSTRFSDGYEYGLGAEIGISTDKLHARGPMGAQDLTTYKYVVRGAGQIRE
jgi:glutamate-5-semialdehyde dehydrogenase